jgi:hypothetical protein
MWEQTPRETCGEGFKLEKYDNKYKTTCQPSSAARLNELTDRAPAVPQSGAQEKSEGGNKRREREVERALN